MSAYNLSMISLLPDVKDFINSLLDEKEKSIDRLMRDARVRIKRRQLLQKINDPNYVPKYSKRSFNSSNRDTPVLRKAINPSNDSSPAASNAGSFTLEVELVQVNFSSETREEQDMTLSILSTPVSDLSEPFNGISSEENNTSLQLRINTQSTHNDIQHRKISKPKRVLRDINYLSDSGSDDNDEQSRTSPVIETQQTLKISEDNSSLESVSILTDDSSNHYAFYSDIIPPPDLEVDYLWQFSFDTRNDTFDSEYFNFGLWKWRLTLYKLSDQSQYALMLSPFHRSAKAKLMCVFTLVGFLRPDHIKRSEENLEFHENSPRYRGCERFIGEDIVQYLEDNDRLTIRAYLCSNLYDGHLVGYNAEAFAQELDTFTVYDLTTL